MSPHVESEATTAEHVGPGPASAGLSTHSITSSGQGQKPEGLISSPATHLFTWPPTSRGWKAGSPCQPGSPFLPSARFPRLCLPGLCPVRMGLGFTKEEASCLSTPALPLPS